MARKTDGVELVISAKDESEKAFKDILESLKELETTAKKGGGLSDLFVGFEKRLDSVAAKQAQVNKALGDTKGIQKSLDTASKYTEVLQRQEAALAKTTGRLGELEAQYADVEKAANAARTPNEKLAESLTVQEAKQASLAQRIDETRRAIAQSTAALTQNLGVDEKASAAMAKQQAVVTDAGRAWRETTKAIAVARSVLNNLGSKGAGLNASLTAGAQRSGEFKTELANIREYSKELDKLAKKDGAGEATKALSRAAKARAAELKAIITQENQAQASLRNELSKTNAEIRKQEISVSNLVKKAGQQKTVYDRLKKSLADFNTQSRAQGTERQTAGITKLQNSLVSLQAAYDATTSRVQAAQKAISAAAAPDPKAVTSLTTLKQRIDEARAAVDREKVSLEQLQTELRDAGVSTDALSNRQKELDKVTENLTAEQARLTAQMRALDKTAGTTGTKVQGIGTTFLNLGRDTRQSLGYLQRIRGELLSIAATYTGLYAVGGAIRSIYDASVLMNRANARLSSVFDGDPKAVADEMAFVRAEADRLKINFEQVLEQYTKFITAIPKGTVPLERIRFIFSGFAEAARVAGLSNDDLQGVFVALTQIVSKGTLSMEELRQQLGDRLPGALQRTAKGLGITSEELIKLVSLGGVKGVESITLLADQLKKDFGTQLPTALQSANASVADFQNAMFDLRIELANSGFIDTLVEGLKEITKAVKSGEFREGAKQFAGYLGEIVKVVVVLVQNIDKVANALKVLLGLMAARTVVNWVTSIYGAGTAVIQWGEGLGKVSTTLTKLTKGVGVFLRALALLPAAFAGGFAIGTYLSKEFAVVRKAGVVLVALFESIRLDIGVVWDKMVATFGFSFRELFNEIGREIDSLIKRASKLLSFSASDIVEEDTSPASGLSAKFEEIDRKAEETRKSTKAILNQMIADIDAGIDQGKDKSLINADATKKEIDKIGAELQGLSEDEIAAIRKAALVGEGEKAAKVLATLRKKIAEALAAIDREIQEKSGDTLDERLESIRGKYDKLLKDIEKAGGGAQFPQAQASIDQLVAIKQVEATEKEINKLLVERRELNDKVFEAQTLGVLTVEEATRRVNDNNARILPQMNEALAKAREIANQINSKPVTQSVDNQAELVAADQMIAKRESLLVIETAINKEMELRSSKIQLIAAQVEAGAISEVEGRAQVLEVNRQTAAQLDELILKAIQFAEAMGDANTVLKLKQMQVELKGLKQNLIEASEINEQFASGLTSALEGFIRGTMSAKEAFRSFVADFLTQIARAIAQALILRAIQSTGWGGAVAGAVNAGVNHTGGVVGQTTSRRRVSVMAFANAAKYHNGGIAGLKPNEVPTILERGEEVLPATDPRHAANGGGSSSTPIQVKIVNTIDSGSVLNEALNSSAGQKTLVNAIRANKSSIKSVLT